jgi:agmatinase
MMAVRACLKRLLGGSVLVTAFLSAPIGLGADWKLPDALKDRISDLDRQQKRFITSGAALNILPARQLEHEIAVRDAASLNNLINDLMGAAESMGYDAGREMGAIPLNTSDEDFNRYTVVTPPALRELDRDPGPFSVQRYLYPASGVPTFAGAKVAIYPEDLVAGGVEVAIIGVPSDMSSGRRDARRGPRIMRAQNTIATPDVDTLVDPMAELSVVDYGDLFVDNMSTERAVGHVTAMVAETAATGAVPMIVGGDTSMLYPGVRGVAEVQGKGGFSLVHFSAHPDADRQAVHIVSDRQALFLLLEEGIVKGENLIQVGLRGVDVDAGTLEWLRGKGVRYHTMAEVGRRGYDAVLERVIAETDDGPDKLFVSIDVSVIEPSEMVAAGRISSRGLSVQEVTESIRYLCAAKEIVGFEITDMAPMLDFSRLSAINANAVLNACLVGMAVRKAGHAPDYIHPLALDHGQG